MNQTAIALLVGLLAGAAGAVVVGFVSGSGGSGTSSVGGDTDMSAITSRLDRIEAALDQESPLGAGALRGDGTAEGQAAAAAAEARLDKLVARLEERLKPTLEESVSASVKKAIEESGTSFDFGELDIPKKKKATMAEVAAELELTAEEEEAVRRIAKETTDAFFKLLTDENTTIEDIRREFEDAKADPAKKIELATKYTGKAMQNLGGLIAVGVGWQQKMRQAVGAEKASKIENNYTITDLDPYGIEDMFDFD